jgi:beta-lactamase superfamily II metal-dependent hydrolase
MRRLAWLLALAALAAPAGPARAQRASPGSASAPASTPVRPGLLTLEVLDVGQGDAVLIRSPEGKTALVDAGPSNRVVSLLRLRGIARLDLVAVSHHHADHYGGMAAVVRAFRPRLFLASNSPHTSAHYLKLLQLVRDQGVQAIAPTSAPRRIELGSAVLTVFPQAPNDPREENNNSIGLRLQYGGFSALLPGDAERNERLWWERAVPKLCAGATVLKLAHHGSRNGTDAPWLALVRPRLAIASLGEDNEFHHPHPETLSLLAKMGIPLLRTDRDGSVLIRTDGARWQVSSHPHVAVGSPVLAHSGSETGARRAESHGKSKGKHPSGPIDLNRASEAELRTLPGIGPVLARRIIEGRPYRAVNELGNLAGIGPRRLAEIRPFLIVR